MPLPRANAEMEMRLFSRFAQGWGAHAPPRAGFGASPKHAFREEFAITEAGALPRGERAFTLIELLVVITIIAVLIGLAFPTYQGIQNQAKKMQAKNDLLQIVTAVNAYYNEYGKYPLTPAPPADTTYGATPTNEQLFNVLRAVTLTENPRGIIFLSPPDAKNGNTPRAGISSAPTSAGQYFDPWGKPYLIRIDTDYDNQITNPYSQNAGNAPRLRNGVAAWSFGKDALSQSTSTPSDKNTGTNRDDVISWQ
jgi:prepilin-type N-terminal cleavage/methylation domain-containing protein